MIPTALLRDTVSVQVYRGPNAYGPAYEAPIELQARMEPRRRLVNRGDGQTIVAAATVFLRPSVTITPQSEVIYEGRIYKALEVLTQKAGSRSAYLEVLLG